MERVTTENGKSYLKLPAFVCVRETGRENEEPIKIVIVVIIGMPIVNTSAYLLWARTDKLLIQVIARLHHISRRKIH